MPQHLHQDLEQGLSGYRYLPTIDAGGGGLWDPTVFVCERPVIPSVRCKTGNGAVTRGGIKEFRAAPLQSPVDSDQCWYGKYGMASTVHLPSRSWAGAISSNLAPDDDRHRGHSVISNLPLPHHTGTGVPGTGVFSRAFDGGWVCRFHHISYQGLGPSPGQSYTNRAVPLAGETRARTHKSSLIAVVCSMSAMPR